MSLERTYKLVCDGCGTTHALYDAGGYSTPRRARAAAKADGWQRIKVVTGRSSYPDSDEPSGVHWYDVIAGRDFCPACAAKESGK